MQHGRRLLGALSRRSRDGNAPLGPSPDGPIDSTRHDWSTILEDLAGPVFEAGSTGRLVATMPVQARPGVRDRGRYSHLEAVARTLCGVAPWLEVALPPSDEARRRDALRQRAIATVASIVDPRSPDCLDFAGGPQGLVEAAFISQALMRAPTALWGALDVQTQGRVVEGLRSTRTIRPALNNWLLFPAMIEASFAALEVGDVDLGRVEQALTHLERWYVGDGAYSDGPDFRWDFDNSFVIHPMLLDVLDTVGDDADPDGRLRPLVRARARRTGEVLERMISPEGTYPPLGRSLTYRFGAFHLLAQLALRRDLPDQIEPASVRCGLGAVMRRQLASPGTFDADGWLRVGMVGDQSGLGERYISTGSLYLCTTALLPLGLPADDPFWIAPPADWTSRRVWSGSDLPADRALESR